MNISAKFHRAEEELIFEYFSQTEPFDCHMTTNQIERFGLK